MKLAPCCREKYFMYLFVSAICLLIAVMATNAFFGIFFETNDDVGMMMLAHGFGLTPRPTSLLLYSNRVVGEIISLIGMPFGQPGYSIFMFACIIFSGAFIIASTATLNGNLFLSVIVTCALYVRPIFSPQFTIVASLLTISAIVTFLASRKLQSNTLLISASMLGLFGLWMRYESAALVLILALPILFRPMYFRALNVFLVILIVGSVAAFAWRWDHASYLNSSWDRYNAVEVYRSWFTDYGLGYLLADRLELLREVGWSKNDLAMISLWWFYDGEIFSPAKLARAAQAAGPLQTFSFNAEQIKLCLGQFLDWNMLPSAILSGVLAATAILRRDWRILSILLIYISIILIFAAAGRPNVTRVTYSGLVALSILCISRFNYRNHKLLILYVTSMASLAVSTIIFIQNANYMTDRHRGILEQLRYVPTDEPIVAWGDALPYQSIYPAFLRDGEAFAELKLYSLGSDELAPYSLAWWNGDMKKLDYKIKSDRGISIIAYDDLIDHLSIYCREHWKGELRSLLKFPIESSNIYNVSCRAEPKT